MEGPQGLKSAAKPGAIVVDCSTSDPTSTVRVAASLAQAGVADADAPLGGTPADAEAARLSTMVGASPKTYERLVPVLQTWAAKSVRIGDVGDGHRMKLLNNFLSLGYGALYAEALTLAQKVGITPKRFDSVIRGGRMDCGFDQTFMRYTLEGDREAHKFSLSNAAKRINAISPQWPTARASPIRWGRRPRTPTLSPSHRGKGGKFRSHPRRIRRPRQRRRV